MFKDFVPYNCKRDYWFERGVYDKGTKCSGMALFEPPMDLNCTSK